MIITFCGHSNFIGNTKYEQIILNYIENYVDSQTVNFYLGGYGNFDSFAYNLAKKYQKSNSCARIYFVTPYISLSYQKNHLIYTKKRYDGIIYPPIENTPPRFAISHRNKWMVEQADIVIAYVKHNSGGAYQTLNHAIKKEKTIFNLTTEELN